MRFGRIIWGKNGKVSNKIGELKVTLSSFVGFIFLQFLFADRAGSIIAIFNEYGELENVKPWDQAEVSYGEVVGELVSGVVSIVSFITVIFMFTGENDIVFCCFSDGEIWASRTMVEEAPVPEVGE